MRVAIAIERFAPLAGGAERYACDLAGHLASRGHIVTAICRSAQDPPPGVSVAIVRVPPLPRALGAFVFARGVAAAARAGGFEIVHAMMKSFGMNVFHPHTGSHAASVKCAVETSRSPVVRALRRAWKRASPKQIAFRMIERSQYAMPPPGLFVAVSRMVMSDMVGLHGVDPARIRVVYNGVNPGMFSPASEAERARARAGMALSRGDFAVTFAARNFRLKGLRTLLDAARILADRTGIRPVILAAGGDRSGPFEAQARAAGLGGTVRFLGPVSDMQGFYRAGDLFVLPTFYDPCSLTVLEAMACGSPAITSGRNGAAELFGGSGRDFVLANPADADALAGMIAKFADPGFRKSASDACRGIAASASSAENFRRIEAVYEEVAGRRG